MELLYKFLANINPISYLVLFTWIVGLVFLNKKKQSSKIILLILFVSTLTEMTAFVALNYGYSISYLYSFYFFIHNGLWLLLLSKIIKQRIIIYSTIAFLVFGILNVLCFEGSKLNYMTFVVSALLYIFFFAIESYRKLKNENLDYFVTNTYLLLFIPILFFFGFSFVFSFRTLDVRHVIIFGKTDLYACISYFVNIAYYFLINFYIYREYHLKND